MKINIDIPLRCPDNIRPYLQHVFDGEYDVKEFVIPAPHIIDLGANCGAFSLWALHRWPGSQVFSYEPHPETYKWLEMNTKHYADIGMIKLNAHGIGNPGLRVLNDGLHNCGENSFHQIMNNPTPTGQHIEVRDPLTLPEADIIKLDIEGCEFEVLEPLIRSGREYKLIMFEYHNHDLRRMLDSLLKDYELVGAEVQHIYGRGVMKYAHKSIMPTDGFK
jgi:FkbM family methyltransferase